MKEPGTIYVVQRGEHQWDPDGETFFKCRRQIDALELLAKDCMSEALDFGRETDSFDFLKCFTNGFDGGVYWKVEVDSREVITRALSADTFLQWKDIRALVIWPECGQDTRALAVDLLAEFEKIRLRNAYHIPWDHSGEYEGCLLDVERMVAVREGQIRRCNWDMTSVEFCDWVDLLRPGDTFACKGGFFTVKSVVAPTVFLNSAGKNHVAEVTTVDDIILMLYQFPEDSALKWEYLIPPITADLPEPIVPRRHPLVRVKLDVEGDAVKVVLTPKAAIKKRKAEPGRLLFVRIRVLEDDEDGRLVKLEIQYVLDLKDSGVSVVGIWGTA